MYPKAEEAYEEGDFSSAARHWREHLEDRGVVPHEHWFWVPELHRLAGDGEGYERALRDVECLFRSQAEWIVAAQMYLLEERYDDFSRVCREEDELEIGALWYEEAEMPERAGEMYELMSRGLTVDRVEDRTRDATGPVAESEPAMPRTTAKDERPTGLCCPSCPQAVKAHWRICPACGKELTEARCACGEVVQLDWPQCPACMRRLGGS